MVRGMIGHGKSAEKFISPDRYNQLRQQLMRGPNGWLLFVGCSAGLSLAKEVCKEYNAFLFEQHSAVKEVRLLTNNLPKIHPDGETCVSLEAHVAGSHAVVFQCVHDKRNEAHTPNENIVHLLQTIYTLKHHGAQTVTVVTPYAPYSRSDRSTFRKREAALARWFADELRNNGASIHLTYHPHTMSLEQSYGGGLRLVALSGMDMFLDAMESFSGRDDVIAVATDPGGAKFTTYFAEDLKISVAVADKVRRSGTETQSLGILGDFTGKKLALIVDDETSTGGTLYKAVKEIHTRGLESQIAISHAKLGKRAVRRFIHAHERYGLQKIHVTDTVPQNEGLFHQPFVEVHCIARTFAMVVNHIHYDQSVSELSNWQKTYKP